MSFIRNASYVMLVDDQAAGFKRVVGSFTEASTFGAVTVGYFGFMLRLWLLSVYPRVTFTLGLFLLLATLLATSTTAYVGLGVYLALTYAEVLIRFLGRRSTYQMRLFLFASPLIFSALLLCIALSEHYSIVLSDLLDTFFFNKMGSASGQERAAWNQGALQSFFDTFGLGFGNGSGRASSFLLAALASLGVAGCLLFSMFFLTLFFGRSLKKPDYFEEAVRQSAKSMCFAWLIASSVSSAVIELGPAFYTFAALASSGNILAQVRAHKRPARRISSATQPGTSY
jgi:hypothetical protein